MRVGIVGQRGNRRAAGIVADLYERLAGMGVAVAVDEESADEPAAWPSGHPDPAELGVPVEELAGCDLVVSIGGDGTFLFAARAAGATPIMGVNLGEVGFLNAVPPEDAVDAVTAEVEQYQDRGAIETRDMPRVEASGDGWSLPPALNEVVVQGPRRGHGGGAAVEVRVDGSLYTSGHADGVLVATPTGSTAYNLSEGGPLVHPGVSTLVLTEMCGEESMPPLAVDADSTVTVRVDDAEGAFVVSDGRARQELAVPAQVTLERAARPVRIAGPPLDFFAALGKIE
ncbi:inorganic polyphosphate/ATP-NAD kinase [Halosimplex carlsbadense 2-9-1]|uniref:NAD kinase n=1 Tax=Halosimplex carlsbadense 2-9-1 TaxID=797114 RepID=M0CTH7_9EURY|nr:NAD(+)/NADH kinase [Halosimplex carlsbadense]ELZ25722.1 inorganic polyphosphate/ATP-NAD kinase [Halosimplex carlsbadense 2-9-1]